MKVSGRKLAPTLFITLLAMWLMGSAETCYGPQTEPGPRVEYWGNLMCFYGPCDTTEEIFHTIATWIYNAVPRVDPADCGGHRYALTAEELLSPDYFCRCGCVQTGLLFTALARENGIETAYIGTVRDDTLAALQLGCWPGDYNRTFYGHYFTLSQGTDGAIIWYDPTAARVPQVSQGKLLKGGHEYTIYAAGADPWDVGIHNPGEFRDFLEKRYCPGGVCNASPLSCFFYFLSQG